MEIKIVTRPMPLSDVATLAQEQFGVMIKATVDVEREVVALGGELHSDEEALLLEDGSKQSQLWGINIYPGKSGADWIEFDSMINVRPSQNNRSRSVESHEIRERILQIMSKMILR
jgi:hypothetical protein